MCKFILSALFLALALPAFGVTASPTSVSVTIRKSATTTYGSYGSTLPNATPITISGSGDWNISRGGDMNTDCGSHNGYCFNATSSITTNAAGAVPTGNGAGTIYLSWDALGAYLLSLGAHTGTLTVGDTTINITATLVAPDDYLDFTYRSTFPVGCSNSSLTNYPFGADTCTISDELPGGTYSAPIAVCDSYVDDAFGYTVRRLTAKNITTSYSATTAFSLNNTYVAATTIPGGATNIYNVSTCATAHAGAPGNISTFNWSPTVDDQYYVITGSTVKLYDLDSLGSPTTLADYSSSSGGRPALASMSFGGTTDITDDGWIAIFDSGADVVCALNLNGMTTGNQESKIFCADYSAYSYVSVDFIQCTEIDSVSGDRYVVLIGDPSIRVWQVDGASPASLAYAFQMPISGQPHSDVGQTADGQQFFFSNFSSPGDNSNYYTASWKFNEGVSSNEPVEVGGGLAFYYPSVKFTSPADTTGDHYGCAFGAKKCIYGLYGNSGNITVKRIAAVTTGTPCSVRTSVAHGFSNGNSVLIGGTEGITGLLGTYTITVVDADEFTTGAVCSGTYTADTANVVLNTSTASDSPLRQELHVVDLNTGTVSRIVQHRSKIYNNAEENPIGYYQTPRASLSRDGRFVAFNSNMGYVENVSVWVIDTLAAETGTVVFPGGGVSGPGTVR